MLHLIAAFFASALPGAFAQTAAELPRIEDFRADLSGAEIEATQAMRTRNLGAQAGTPRFAANADGSPTITLEAQSRSRRLKATGCLPPRHGFLIALRAYLAKEAIVNGAWFPPAIQKGR